MSLRGLNVTGNAPGQHESNFKTFVNLKKVNLLKCK